MNRSALVRGAKRATEDGRSAAQLPAGPRGRSTNVIETTLTKTEDALRENRLNQAELLVNSPKHIRDKLLKRSGEPSDVHSAADRSQTSPTQAHELQ